MQFLLRQSKCALPAVKCNQTPASSPSEKVQKIPTPVTKDQASEQKFVTVQVQASPVSETVSNVSTDDRTDSCDTPVQKTDVDTVESIKLESDSPGEQFIDGLEVLLTRWVNSAAAMNSQESLEFCSPRAPKISIRRYLSRIYDWFSCSDECYVMALVYIHRIVKMNSSVEVCNRSVHRLLFFAMMLAAKYHDDVPYANSYYAKVGGLTLEEVNTLELKFLDMLDWKMFVDGKEYQIHYDLVCEAAIGGLWGPESPKSVAWRQAACHEEIQP